jgi:hypothetical protein
MGVSNNSKALNVSKIQRRSSAHDSGEDSEGENEVIEESPNGRWTKRNEQVGLLVVWLFKVTFLSTTSSSLTTVIDRFHNATCPQSTKPI